MSDKACNEGTEVVNGYTVTVEHDDDVENPLDREGLVHLAILHRRADYGDARYRKMQPEELDKLAAGVLLRRGIALPVRFYSHGGVTFSTSTDYPFNDRFDSGWAGWIWMEPAEIREFYGVRRITAGIRERARGMLENTLQAYSNWLGGECYQYTIRGSRGDIAASCCGYYDLDQCWSDARARTTELGPEYVKPVAPRTVDVFRDTDWALLREQKAGLLGLVGRAGISEPENQALQGVVHLIDALQDQAADVLGIPGVFGPEGQKP